MKITDYGKSMYGGWYANYITDDCERDGEHADTLKELCAKLNICIDDIKKISRYDN